LHVRLTFRRRPDSDDAEREDLHSRVLARLFGATSETIPVEPVPSTDADPIVRDVVTDGLQETAVGVMAEPGTDAWHEPVPVMASAAEDPSPNRTRSAVRGSR
jgi:hypothetical protein